MTTEELKNNFAQTIIVWENALDDYSEKNFAIKENEESWSVGQVYEHLTSMTKRIFTLTERLSKINDNDFKEKTKTGKTVFKKNEIADKKTKIPTVIQVFPSQPESKARVKKELIYLKEHFSSIYDLANQSDFNGKYEHPVLGFLNAMEWLQFSEMHFRHHLRQKNRIDDFIKTSYKSD